MILADEPSLPISTTPSTITSSNLVVLCCTIHTPISRQRQSSLIHAFQPYGIPVMFRHGHRYHPLADALNANIRTMLEYVHTTFGPHMHVIICDDDWMLCDPKYVSFLSELNQTVALLPDTWETLHLCPGFLWGRNQRQTHFAQQGQFRAEPIGQHFLNSLGPSRTDRCVSVSGSILQQYKGWLGGPIAFLVRQTKAHSVATRFEQQRVQHPTNINDVLLCGMCTVGLDYLCIRPLLGYEEEAGGSTVAWK